ncbi:hypothetical protein [Nocardiopsis sp. NRRL B-16309]|uniref:hypothetical protein n=1 Tax=Nocardiopsis sp. NRRL B-16309 TaxID=1519494 RepID=UPI0006AFDEFC|nr:hypothetical protein [Nocardiopsis sp. NRRL B-16309]KOX10173.1 hypothetical protein ADL05_26230 [Nocardiopsis sp. NRRL B-16309]
MPKPRKPSLVLMGLAHNLPDRRTALADLRTALCLHIGVDMADIDPASGYNRSLDSYLRVRATWVRAHEESPGSDWTARSSKEARANWERVRPQYLADHPWPEAPALPSAEDIEALAAARFILAAPAFEDVPLPNMP